MFAEMVSCDDRFKQFTTLHELKGQVVLVLGLIDRISLVSQTIDAMQTSKKSRILITFGWERPCRTSVSSCTTDGLALTKFSVVRRP